MYAQNVKYSSWDESITIPLTDGLTDSEQTDNVSTPTATATPIAALTLLELTLKDYKKQYFKVEKNAAGLYDEPCIDRAKEILLNELKLPVPKLLLSITGGAKEFSLDEESKEMFKSVLMRVATSTNGWLITGGTDVGVMRLVGDAVKEEIGNCNQTVLGIGHWNSMTYGNPAKDRKANPNHSCFIFVADAVDEIEFRTALEKRLKDVYSIPSILIVIDGGIGTLKTIVGALENVTPVLVVDETGGCADLMKDIKELNPGCSIEDNFETLKKKASFKNFFKKLDQKSDANNNDDKKQGIDETIMSILVNLVSYKRYINSYNLSNDHSTAMNFENAILKAFSNAYKPEQWEQMVSLCIKWGCLDLAKTYLKNINNDKEKIDKLPNLLELALVHNRPEIIKLFLPSIKLEKFPTFKRLTELYNNPFKNLNRMYYEPFYFCHQKKNRQQEPKAVTLEDVKTFLKNVLDIIDCNSFFPARQTKSILMPELNIFIWCVLSHRIESAKLFWKLGQNQIFTALLAAKIFKQFAKRLPDEAVHFKAVAKEFEGLATGILDVQDECTRTIVNDVLVIRYLKMFRMDCLELAVAAKCRQFVAHDVSQRAIRNIWNGNRDKESYSATQYENDLIAIQNHFNADPDYSLNREKQKRNGAFSCLPTCLSSPKMKHHFHVISYFIFLFFFTSAMLFNTDKAEPDKVTLENPTNVTVLDKNAINSTRIEASFFSFNNNTVYYMLMLWVAAYFVEEIKQAVFIGHSARPWFQKVKKYFGNNWNLLDISGCVFYFIGCFFLFVENPTIGRGFLSIDLGIWYFRSLQLWLKYKRIGPIIFIIREMIKDFLYFLTILLTVLIAFGVTQEAILTARKEATWENLKETLYEIIHKAYWPIHGEITVLESLNRTDCKNSTQPCNESHVFVAGYALSMIYMIIASVLLLNLLIALFASTYDKIKENSDIVWKNQQFSLVMENVHSLFLPPPLNFLEYILIGINYLYSKITSNEPNVKMQEEPKTGIFVDLERACAGKVLKDA